MIKVTIIDSHRVLTDTLKLVLNREVSIKLIGAAADINNARQLLNSQSPDVLLLEVNLPDGDGVELIPYIQEKSPKTKIIILTSSVDDILVMRAIKHNVHGILSKDCSLDELLSSIRAAANNEMAFASHLLVEVIRRRITDPALIREKEYIWERLTDRELDVLNCLALGKSGSMIANELNITPMTVRTHIRNIMSKLGVHSRLEAVSFALTRGIIETPN